MLTAAREEKFSAPLVWTDDCALPLTADPFSSSHVTTTAQLSENSRLGFASKNPAPHQGSEFANSTSALGIEPVLVTKGFRSPSSGRENDGTGLYFNRARYYSPTLQRFISEDPIGFGGGDVNLYAYVSNGPISSKDSFGMARDCFASWCQRVPSNPLPGRKAPSGAGAAPTNPGGTPEPTEPNPAVTAVADAVGVAGSVVGGKAGKVLGPASTIISVANDPSPENIGINALGLIPGLDVPIALGSAAWDGSKFAANQVVIPVFTPNTPQNITVNGVSIPNPVLMDDAQFFGQ